MGFCTSWYSLIKIGKVKRTVSLKIVVGIFFVLSLSACQVSTKHEIVRPLPVTLPEALTENPVKATETPPVQEEPGTTHPALVPAPLSVGNNPKVGLILGPGALRAFAHVGVVQEFAKAKIPIQAIVGIEMGALVAAIYANKGQPYDVEWQMMKLKESDLVQKALLSSQVTTGDVKSLSEFINLSLSSARAENAKVSFACPAYNMGKAQAYLMNRGSFAEMLPFCLAFPPLFKPFRQNVSGVLDLNAAVEYVRSKGATYVVYVDLLSGPAPLRTAGSENQVLWSLTTEALTRQEKGLDYVIHVPLQDYDLLDYNHRREMIQSGQRAAIEALQQISKKLGL